MVKLEFEHNKYFMYMHCNTHNMNLAFQDAVSKVHICRDAMKTVRADQYNQGVTKKTGMV